VFFFVGSAQCRVYIDLAMSTSKRTPYELREARKRIGLSMAKIAAFSGIALSTWEQWEASLGSKSHRRTPELAFRFIRCYELLEKHNLLEDFTEAG
jgi:transcriptional regulator with XRE-family HTH domain